MIKKIYKKIVYELRFDNPQYYHRISEKVLKTYYQKKLKSLLQRLNPIELQTKPTELTVCMLSGHRHFLESVAAIYSFSAWERNFNLHYHEDGTLTANEIEYLQQKFKGIKIFKKIEQNDKIDQFLTKNNLVKSAELRKKYVFALRLFDAVIDNQSPFLLQFDSDVLFFKKPEEILDIIEKKDAKGCFNKDIVDAYTFSPETLNKYIKNPMLKMFNCGLFLHQFEKLPFFNFIEEILTAETESLQSWHIEQTLFAMYATNEGGYKQLPIAYDLAKKERNRGNAITSEHYVHSTGYDFHKDFIYKVYPTIKEKF